jgi:hypothetical protein
MPHGPRHKPVTTVLLSCLLWSLAFRCCYSYYYSSFGSVQIWSLQLPQLVARAIGERTFFSAAASFFSPGRETIVSVHHEKSILCSSSICKSPAESSDEAVLKAKGEYRHGWMDGGVEDGRGKGQNLPSGSAGSQPASHPSQPQRRILVASRGKRGRPAWEPRRGGRRRRRRRRRGRGPRGGGLLVGWLVLVRPGSPRSPAVIARQKIDRVFDRVPPSSTGARARRTAPSSWSRSPPGSRAASPPILAGGSQRWRTVPPADRDSCLAGGSASVQVASVWRKTAGFSQNA